MKLSLLDMVQDILSDMDSDEVNSISDTTEALQVAQIVKTTYYEMISNRNWAHLNKLITLQALGDSNKPTHVFVPELAKKINFINYDTNEKDGGEIRFTELKYKSPEEFLRITNNRNSKDVDNILIVRDIVDLLIATNKSPSFYTSFNEKEIVLDSYNKQVESTIQSRKFQCQAYIIPEWEHVDNFIPDLPSEAFSGLLAEAKSSAFSALKQEMNSKAEQKATRQRRWLSQSHWTVSDTEMYPNYGRIPRK